ncbi:hypothetical protein PENSPDRAFT_758796 [Peniophora sp. CONT]|nr:hypothetical protein PENSPDRAFT_758796 [Peniophora sp. CONT]
MRTVAPIPIPPLPGQKATPHTAHALRSTPPHATTVESLSELSNTEESGFLGDCWNAVYECDYDVLAQVLDYANPSEPPLLSNDWNSPLALDTEDDKANYPPLIEWLNRAASASPTVRDTVQFYIWDRPLETLEEKKSAPKPNAIPALCNPLLDLNETWLGVAVTLEIKGDWREALKQAFRCARKLLNVGNRWFAPLIIVNHKSKQARFVIATHLGIFITSATSLEISEGRRPLAQIVLSLSALTHRAAGYGTSALHIDDTLYFSLPLPEGLWSWWRVVQVLCNRESLHGKATRVYKLEKVTEKDELGSRMSVESLTVLEPKVLTTGSITSPAANTGPQLGSLPDICAKDVQHLKLVSMIDWERLWATSPRTLIMKDSYPLVEQARVETEFLTTMQHQHGFAPIMGAMVVEHDYAQLLSMKGLRRCETPPEDGAVINDELREHRRLLSAVEGKPLSEASALDVVYVCVDCMIGIYNAYSLNWLHRDISSGNVLFRLSPETRNDKQVDGNACLEKLEVAEGINVDLLRRHLRQCKCVIIDGDAAVRMEEREFATLKSGTMEFMSIRGLRAWAVSGGTYHCILDDMEAVFWLLVHTLVVRKSQEERTVDENGFLTDLGVLDARQLAASKVEFIGPNGAGTRIDWIDGDMDIVNEWLDITAQLNKEAENIFSKQKDPRRARRVPREPQEVDAEKLREVAHRYFSRYLMAGLEFLDSAGAYGSST